MKKLDLFLERQICLFLNASDKLRTLLFISKHWYNLIYSGYAWESLFDQSYDPQWKIQNVSKPLLTKFKHFKGIKKIVLPINASILDAIYNHINQFHTLKIHYGQQQMVANIRQIMETEYYEQIESKIENSFVKQVAQFKMVYHCEISQLMQLINNIGEQVVNLNVKDKLGNTLLHYLMMQREFKMQTLQVFNFLIKNKVRPIRKNKNGDTQMHLAIKFNAPFQLIESYKMVDYDFKTQNSQGLTQLNYVQIYGDQRLYNTFFQKNTKYDDLVSSFKIALQNKAKLSTVEMYIKKFHQIKYTQDLLFLSAQNSDDPLIFELILQKGGKL